MSARADLALYNQNGQMAAMVEVKNKLGTSREWATQLRRNILAHGEGARVDFFLLVTPDRLYVWKNADPVPILVPPTYEIDAQPIFAPYFKSASVSTHHVSAHAFELIVAAWLGDLVRSEGKPVKLDNGQSWLAESGFLAMAKDGRIEYEVVM